MKKSLILFFTIVLVLTTFTILFLQGFFFQLKDGEISLIEEVEIGGSQQWIMANGENADLPVLLWLHGGPGASQMPVARHFNKNLEDEYIVVQWDQRGAGKSNPALFDESTMTMDRFVSDVDEMTNYLLETFEKEKIFLIGHSWGSQIGITAVSRNPEKYYAYIAVGQVTNTDVAQEVAYVELQKRIKGYHNYGRTEKENLRKLDELGVPPYRVHNDYLTFLKMFDRYDMNMDIDMHRLIFVALGSGIYEGRDFFQWFNGYTRGSGPMWKSSQSWDISKRISDVNVPCYFLFGDNDFNTPVVVAEEYLENVNCLKKEIIVIPDSAHMPFFSQPNVFFEEMILIKKTEMHGI